MNNKSLNKILDLIKEEIIPMTKEGIKLGNKIFGAAIIKKTDFSTVIVGTNSEIENPLWHGEMATLKKFYEIPASFRPHTKDCYFISSHEPCSLCLSAISWCGFDNFYYLFSYKDTLDKFNIPHDLNILKEVFNVNDGNYNKSNFYWKCYHLEELINHLKDNHKEEILNKLTNIKALYEHMSKYYQSTKINNEIPLK